MSKARILKTSKAKDRILTVQNAESIAASMTEIFAMLVCAPMEAGVAL